MVLLFRGSNEVSACVWVSATSKTVECMNIDADMTVVVDAVLP